jgi:hypothetical protein
LDHKDVAARVFKGLGLPVDAPESFGGRDNEAVPSRARERVNWFLNSQCASGAALILKGSFSGAKIHL